METIGWVLAGGEALDDIAANNGLLLLARVIRFSAVAAATLRLAGGFLLGGAFFCCEAGRGGSAGISVFNSARGRRSKLAEG